MSSASIMHGLDTENTPSILADDREKDARLAIPRAAEIVRRTDDRDPTTFPARLPSLRCSGGVVPIRRRCL